MNKRTIINHPMKKIIALSLLFGLAASGAAQDVSIEPAVRSMDKSAGTYHVVVSNQYGQAESEGANLVVQEMPRIPSIESQPKGQTAGEGSTVVFRVTASGAEPLKYRWKRDGVFLGAKSPSPELVLKNVKRTQAGVYRVEVSNNLGQVLSESAKLIVTKAAPSTLRFSSVTIDGKGHLTMEVAGPKGSNAVFQYSIDLNEWIDQFALPLPNGTASFKTLNSNSEKLFYRLKLME